jgi:hypothetical protein
VPGLRAGSTAPPEDGEWRWALLDDALQILANHHSWRRLSSPFIARITVKWFNCKNGHGCRPAWAPCGWRDNFLRRFVGLKGDGTSLRHLNRYDAENCGSLSSRIRWLAR